MKQYLLIIAVAALAFTACCSKTENTDNPADKVLLSDFRPVNVNNIPANKVEKAKYPVIDMHSHDYAENDEQIKEWIQVMDAVGVQHTAVMHCAWIGRPFEEVAQAYAPYKERFRLWCCFDYTDIDTPEGLENSLKTLERYHEMGAVGIGELGDKGFGDLYARPVEGMGIHLDDPRVKPLLEKCAELKMPVSIHIGEPVWMYLPMDETNDGLPNGAAWHVDTTDVNCLGYYGLVNTFENAVRENPQTLFIACHYLNMNHDLPRLGAMLDRYPNMYIDIAARVAEAAQTPRATRDFIIRYQDRIIFGTDNGMSADMYHNIFRVLETNDEHFYIPEYNYHWYLSGLNLPDEVLQKIYYKNAERILNEYK
ncbi:MAG: amidohydrolase family protein [Paludibacteraceae bacterium]|nr:amidohydrolase family protein [Paludibacteraceae bacterium]